MNIPDLTAYEGLPDRTLLDSKAVSKVFGVVYNGSSVTNNIRRGHIPPHSFRGKRLIRRHKHNVPIGNHKQGRCKKLYWTLRDLRVLAKGQVMNGNTN